ncbi:PLP-dependent aminotransferase family protein [Vibrio sp. Y2-5]|uniref:MocR-like pyridoxine biosynthesis transcription factor PdxR n=1 Tax=Vibrio sp. Y2-5 TaxID=2743977 RepID=UPI00166058E9|nr:PLP-dependent aminotransferase family protein [Vibrio sp. Y2-5]MBD0787240.1 PLP-dependent aminotransferase family protein [Vibrio sp. Y2-5]
MQPIDSGDLVLQSDKSSKQESLFHAIREKIVKQLWHKGGKLPSTRKLAEELQLSRNTVTAAYEQLAAEGYIEARSGSGFYVSVELPDHYLPNVKIVKSIETHKNTSSINSAFAPGVPDLHQFPIAKWHKYVQLHSTRQHLLGNNGIQGDSDLRMALGDYLATSRSVHCDASQIIITSGAQQALMIALMAVMESNDSILMEQPGYSKMRKIIELLNYQFEPVHVEEYVGFDLENILNSKARTLYITPSNQYPMGTTLNTEQRLKLIEWATQGDRWIIEDDYDSEFQFAHRPYTSLQGLSSEIGNDSRVIYVGSFSKTMFNSLRMGYLIVPSALVNKCLAIKDALTGDSPAHIQAAIADFISSGDFLRHIRKMRRLYKDKHQQMTVAIHKHFGNDVEIISQAAGLHVTLKWQNGANEVTLSQKALEKGIIVRPLSYYEHPNFRQRNWQGLVLGFGNTSMDDIDVKIKQIADLFYNLGIQL